MLSHFCINYLINKSYIHLSTPLNQLSIATYKIVMIQLGMGRRIGEYRPFLMVSAIFDGIGICENGRYFANILEYLIVTL